MALVTERIAGAVAQHVGPDPAEPRSLTSFSYEVIYRLARHRLPTLGDEQPGQMIRPHSELPLDGTQLVALNRLFGIERIL